MRKLLSLALVAAMAVGVAHAVPAKRGFNNFTQSDGSTISVELQGDEFMHAFVTSDGLTVRRADNGDFYYTSPQGMSQVRAHNAGQRTSDELAYISANQSQMNMVSLAVAAQGNGRASIRHNGPAKVGDTQVPNQGVVRVPVLLVEYQDKAMANTVEAMNETYQTGEVSAHQYFADQSKGKFDVQYELFGIYTLSGNRSTYGGNNWFGNDVGVGTMVAEAVDSASAEGLINWANYDNDGDGQADVVIVVYAGTGEAQGGPSSSVWPCQWSLSSSGDGVRYYDGVSINKFAVFNEINGSNDNSTRLDGIGTFCHEFGHCLGLPDFYETTYRNGYYGMGNWSIMDHASYNNNGYTPIGYNGYEKSFMGWVDLIEPQEGSFHTLPTFGDTASESDYALKIVSPLNENEYYVLENRRKQGWDAYIPDEGLLVSHVSYVASRWDNNTPNNEAVQLMTVIPADGKLDSGSERYDLFGETNHALTDDTDPAAVLYLTANGSITSNAGKMGKPITNINITSNGDVTLWFMMNEVLYNPELLPLDTAQVTTNSFVAEWTDETDEDKVDSYTLEVSYLAPYQGDAYFVTGDDFSGGTTTWNTSTAVYNDVKGYLRLGSAKYNGQITSPALDLSGNNGKVTVRVKAKVYNKDTSVPMTLSVLAGPNTDEVLASKDFVLLNNVDQVFEAVLDANATDSSVVRIESTRLGKRVLVSGVKVYSGDAAGIDYDDPTNGGTSARKVITIDGDSVSTLTIDGIAEKQYTVTGLVPGGAYTYRVRSNWSVGSASGWSGVQSVVLKKPEVETLVGDINMDGLVDAADVTALIGVVLGQPAAGDADVNGDGQVDAADVTALINIILG